MEIPRNQAPKEISPSLPNNRYYTGDPGNLKPPTVPPHTQTLSRMQSPPIKYSQTYIPSPYVLLPVRLETNLSIGMVVFGEATTGAVHEPGPLASESLG